MPRNRKSIFKKLTIKGLVLGICAWSLAILGVVFASSMGELQFLGLARVHEFTLSDKLPVKPIWNAGAGPEIVSVLDSLPFGINRSGDSEWDEGNTKLTIYLIKPQSAPSPDNKVAWPGDPDVAFTLYNDSSYPFSLGDVFVSGLTGNWNGCGNCITPSLSTTSVSAGNNFTVGLNFNTAVSASTTDYAKITVTYEVLNAPRTMEIDVYFVPNLYGMIVYSPSSWTNGSVTATLTASTDLTVIPSGWTKVSNRIYTKNYSDNTPSPETVTITDGVNTSTVSSSVTWIDKIAPTYTFYEIIKTGYTTINVGMSGVNDTGGSGLAGCRYSVDNGATWLPAVTNVSDCTNYQLAGLAPETGYGVLFRVYDNAGNYAQSPGASFATTLLLTGLPLTVDSNNQGYYFNLSSLSPKLAGTSPLDNTWDGQIFTFILTKPSTAVQGNEEFAFTSMPITNIGDVPWTNGTISASLASGGFNPIGTNPKNSTVITITPTTVNVDASMTFTFSFNGKVQQYQIDFVKATITYNIAGITPSPYFDIYWYYIPYGGYSLDYDANGGSGHMPGSACGVSTSNGAPANCAWDATYQSGIRANAFTPPSGMTFHSWNTKDDGTGTSFAAGATIPAGTFAPNSTNTLYAIWQ